MSRFILFNNPGLAFLSRINPVVSLRMMTAQTCSLKLFKMTKCTRWSETCKQALTIIGKITQLLAFVLLFPHSYTYLVNLSDSFLLLDFLNRKQRSEKYIMTAAKLIAPAIETSFAAGFDWFVLLFCNPDQICFGGLWIMCQNL